MGKILLLLTLLSSIASAAESTCTIETNSTISQKKITLDFDDNHRLKSIREQNLKNGVNDGAEKSHPVELINDYSKGQTYRVFLGATSEGPYYGILDYFEGVGTVYVNLLSNDTLGFCR